MSSFDQYVKRGKKYGAQVRDYLKKKEFEKASEVAWGSVAEMIKAVALAKTRQQLRSHRDIRNYVRLLARQRSDEEMFDLFEDAESLHRNFYEGDFDEMEVREKISSAEELVRKLLGILISNGQPT